MSKNGITLYRGETPGAVGFDVHGGFGQTWTTDAEYAAGYADPPSGYVKEGYSCSTHRKGKGGLLIDYLSDCF